MPAPLHIKSTFLKVDFVNAKSSSSCFQSATSVSLNTTLLGLEGELSGADTEGEKSACCPEKQNGWPHPLPSRKSLRAGVYWRSATTTLAPFWAKGFAKARLIPGKSASDLGRYVGLNINA